MTISYNLKTLLKLRQQNNNYAERLLMEAEQVLESEQKKLLQIKQHLDKNRLDRAILQDNFFLKAKLKPSNQREILNLAQVAQKKLQDQSAIIQSLSKQSGLVAEAETKKTSAAKTALETHRELKAINKHHALWQQKAHKREELKCEYNNDDQNSSRFWLKKRA